jgi:hypothetical protein
MEWAPAGGMSLRGPLGFQLVTQRAVIAALEPPFLSLPLPCLDQVPQTAGSLCRRFPAFRAAAIPLHPELVLPLARNRQPGEFILYRLSHLVRIK